MKKLVFIAVLVLSFSILGLTAEDFFKLPTPHKDLALSKLLEGRESVRKFTEKAISLQELASILWAGQGMKSSSKKRTTPSAGALYPMELYLIAGNVSDLKAGIYHYEISSHSLKLTASGDKRKELLEKGAIRQDWVSTAPAIICITYVKSRTEGKYKERAQQYIGIETGAVMQNIYLMAQAIGLGTCAVGAFDDEKVKAILNLKEEDVVLLMPVGQVK
ncbi:MAG: SagB/ThcOx family dehydrogenase [Acidobacteria bacterium]|nr:SagB/ThcOx family dehydrogenase [Acidobacteriota bacterium]